MFATSTFGQSVDEKEIRFLESQWTELLNQGNTDALQEIWSKEYVVNNPNGKIVTPKEIILLMKKGHQFPLVERIIEKITFNHNIAIVMGKELQQPANKLEDRNIWLISIVCHYFMSFFIKPCLKPCLFWNCGYNLPPKLKIYFAGVIFKSLKKAIVPISTHNATLPDFEVPNISFTMKVGVC